MVTRPDNIIIKPAKTAQNWCFGIGTFLGFTSFGAFSSGDGGPGIVLALIAFVLFFVGSKIKTKKKWHSSLDIYK